MGGANSVQCKLHVHRSIYIYIYIYTYIYIRLLLPISYESLYKCRQYMCLSVSNCSNQVCLSYLKGIPLQLFDVKEEVDQVTFLRSWIELESFRTHRELWHYITRLEGISVHVCVLCMCLCCVCVCIYVCVQFWHLHFCL